MPLTATGFPDEASFTEKTNGNDTGIPGEEAFTGNHRIKEANSI